MAGLCLIAVFAIAAIAATSAFALPEWGKCELTGPGGKYSDANCTVKAKKGAGEYTWVKGTALKPVRFKGHNVGSGGVLRTLFRSCSKENAFARTTRADCAAKGYTERPGATLNVECEQETAKGETVGKKSIINVQVTFEGCKAFGVLPCSNTKVAGQVKVNPLKGSLGYISKGEKTVGVLLEPSQKHGPFAQFECGGLTNVRVGVGNAKEGAYFEPESKGGWDGIISPITPVNEMTKAFTQVYTMNSENENIPSKFEGKHIDLLEDYEFPSSSPGATSMWSRAGEEITNVNEEMEEVGKEFILAEAEIKA